MVSRSMSVADVPDPADSLAALYARLNPMENVWDCLRQKKLCTLAWQTNDDILDACQSA